MESFTYNVEITIGRDHLYATTVQGASVDDAAATALEEIGGARFQDPRHPVPEVKLGDAEVIGHVDVFGTFDGARPVHREIIE